MAYLLGRLYGRMGTAYFRLYVAFELVSAFLVCLATVGLFSLYTDTTAAEFLQVAVFAEACVALAVGWLMYRAAGVSRPVRDWVRDRRDPLGAWRCAVALPRTLGTTQGWQPFLLVGLPIAVYFTVQFELPAYSALIIFAGAAVAVAYAAVLHFFASEMFMRPVLEDIASDLPSDFTGAPLGVPLRWKLLGALPVINVITGVVVSGLSTDGSARLEDLGVDVVVALLVAFTISLELTLLLTRSIIGPVEDLLVATKAVREGNLDARVPVVSGDELGSLAGSFNGMMSGLAERETLREALGSYVAPEVAERVIAEGKLIDGQEVEVTVMVVDIRDFTSMAARSSARETVAFLNEFFGLVVPLITEHGGHANKFLGDGVLAVFGAPEQLPDHPDRALECARAIALAVEQRFSGGVRVGIGINSGPVITGSVGGGGRLEFAVIGDSVNVAARVESFTRDTGDVILCTDAVRSLLSRPHAGLEPRGDVQLRGVPEPVALYALLLDPDERPSPHVYSAKADA